MSNDKCKQCELHKLRAQNWRKAAYQAAGYPLPDSPATPTVFEVDANFDLLIEKKLIEAALQRLQEELDAIRESKWM